MKNYHIIASTLLIILFLAPHSLSATSSITESAMTLYDKSRDRQIPIQIYSKYPLDLSNKTQKHVIIINHGYTAQNTEYSFLARALAANDYIVISIQHELPQDPPLPTEGNLYQLRKPIWEYGVKNIQWVLHYLKKTRSDLNLNKITLIGHSNGGDMIMLFAAKYPRLVSSLIDLDSLRMPFPRTKKFPILTIRANDTKADPEVLPPKNQLKKCNITFIKIPNAKHIDLCDRGSKKIKQEINNVILHFLKSLN